MRKARRISVNRLRFAWETRTPPWRVPREVAFIGTKRPPEHVFEHFRRLHGRPASVSSNAGGDPTRSCFVSHPEDRGAVSGVIDQRIFDAYAETRIEELQPSVDAAPGSAERISAVVEIQLIHEHAWLRAAVLPARVLPANQRAEESND